MSITDEADLKGITEASQVAKHLRETLQSNCAVGVTTTELDDLCRRELRAIGAESAPRKHYNAPCYAFYSVNSCVVHGLPTSAELRFGDLVTIDVTPTYHGYISDTACTLIIGDAESTSVGKRLIATAELAFQRSLQVCQMGRRVNEIGREIEITTWAGGFFVVPELSGHGVGRAIHEEPSVLNYFDHQQKDILTEGLVIAIEPMIVNRRSPIRTKQDGWSIVTASGTLTAHFEHTVLITRSGPVVLTA